MDIYVYNSLFKQIENNQTNKNIFLSRTIKVTSADMINIKHKITDIYLKKIYVLFIFYKIHNRNEEEIKIKSHKLGQANFLHTYTYQMSCHHLTRYF